MNTGKTFSVTQREYTMSQLKLAVQAMMQAGQIPRQRYLVKARVSDSKLLMHLHDPITDKLIVDLSGGVDGRVSAKFYL